MMGDQIKKVSFGFSKIAKKTPIVLTHLGLNTTKQANEVSKVELIDCLEGKSIKLKEPIELNDGPLIIPLIKPKEEKNSESQQVNAVGLLNVGPDDAGLNNESQNKPTNEPSKEDFEESNTSNKPGDINKTGIIDRHETLDQIAAREILEELNRKKTEEDEKRVFNVPLTSNAPLGEKESTLEDYENVPVTEFGMAVLRGMGWAPGKGIGKTEKLVAPTLPTPRPKGMGLGADVFKSVDKKSSNEELKMIKGGFIRVLGGPEKDAYGQIEGFDDESGRLIVKLALKNVSVSLNEFMVQLVGQNEFKKNSKVINASKYEQYKEEEVKKESGEKKPLEAMKKAQNKEHVSKYEQYKEEKVNNGSDEKKPLEAMKKAQNKEQVTRSLSKKYDNKSKGTKKNRSSSSESPEESFNRDKKRSSSDSTWKIVSSKKNAKSRSSRSPYDRNRRNVSPRSPSRSHKSQSTKHENSSRHTNCKSLKNNDKKHRSYSSDSSDSSSSSKNTSRNKSSSSKTKSAIKDRSLSRRRSYSIASTSSDSSGHHSRKKESKPKKKKTLKYRSRSRSRSPRKHKHKKSKKCRRE